VLVGSALSIALSVWTAEAGGRIRHPEFRPELKPTAQPQQQGQGAPSVPEPIPSPSPSASMTPLPPLPAPPAYVVPGTLLAPAGSGATPTTN
jgi:hypothetical protein